MPNVVVQKARGWAYSHKAVYELSLAITLAPNLTSFDLLRAGCALRLYTSTTTAHELAGGIEAREKLFLHA